MTTTDQSRAAALAAKAEDQRKRDTVKRANNRALRALPETERDAILRHADAVAAVEVQAGTRRSMVYVIRDTLAAHEAARSAPEPDAEVRTCRTCGEEKPVADFPKYRPGQCRPCYNAQWKAWNAAKKAEKAATA